MAPEFVVGPVYCPMCLSADIEASPCMSYSASGDGWCEVCGYKYVAGTKWIITEEDLNDARKTCT